MGKGEWEKGRKEDRVNGWKRKGEKYGKRECETGERERKRIV